ncbi:MAG: transposase, partial [Planctomycetaceae bacterium]
KNNSLLFLHLLWELTQRYPEAKVIPVILDNYAVHKTRQVERALETEQGRRLKLRFLPASCPAHNKIERTWQNLHADVTRNHTCPDMNSLMRCVRGYLCRRSHHKRTPHALRHDRN